MVFIYRAMIFSYASIKVKLFTKWLFKLVKFFSGCTDFFVIIICSIDGYLARSKGFEKSTLNERSAESFILFNNSI